MSYIDDLISKTKGEKKPESKSKKRPAVTQGNRKKIDSYDNVEVFEQEGSPLKVYSVPVIKPSGPEKKIVNTIQEAATRLIPISPEEFRDPKQRRNYYLRQVKEIINSSPELKIPATKSDFYAKIVVQEMIGYGILDELVQDFQLEEIMVIGPETPVYVFHRKYGMMKTNIVFGNDEEIKSIISRIARQVNRRVDVKDPLLDARLPDGSRVNATIKPISVGGSTLTIRKFRAEPLTIADLVKRNTLDKDIAAYLWYAVEGANFKPANILVSGGTSSGKTTTLNVLSSMIPADERIISIEDTAELMLPLKHWVRFETRPPGLEGSGEITMNALVKNALRMRPDRVIVGEVRGDEAFTMFTAMNTGHDGSMGTLHANSAEETVTRITNPPMNVPETMANALDFIIIQQRIRDRKKGMIRRITEIAEVIRGADSKLKIQTLYHWDPVSDSFIRSKVEPIFDSRAKKYTGMSDADFKDEIEKRKKIIEDLVMNDKTKLDEVSNAIQNYYSKEIGTSESGSK